MDYELLKPFCLWFTGLPSSGKTTLAKAVKDELEKSDVKLIQLDGDVLRKGMCSDLGFSQEDRKENNRRVIYIAQLLVDNDVPAVVSFISPYRSTREFAKETIKNTIEVFVECPVEECQKRDVKGLYAKAAAGEIKNMTGVDDPYEVPENPDCTIKSMDEELEESMQNVIAYLLENGFVRKD